MSSGSDYNIHSVITKVDKPVCIFGDGCLIKLHNEEHSHNYDHAKRRFLPKCMQDPECKYYRDVRGFIMNGGGYVTKELKYAQNHVALCYHSPIYTNFISNHRSRRSVSTNINPFLKKTEVPKLGTNKLDKIDGPPSGSTEIESTDLLVERLSPTLDPSLVESKLRLEDLTGVSSRSSVEHTSRPAIPHLNLQNLSSRSAPSTSKKERISDATQHIHSPTSHSPQHPKSAPNNRHSIGITITPKLSTPKNQTKDKVVDFSAETSKIVNTPNSGLDELKLQLKTHGEDIEKLKIELKRMSVNLETLREAIIDLIDI